jgi:hypothetical protein
VVDGDYMITADASLEGKVQRAVTAPMQGYIVEARARAGDIVRRATCWRRWMTATCGWSARSW